MAVNFRKYGREAHSLDELMALGTITVAGGPLPRGGGVAAGLDVQFSGGTQAGNKTLPICLARPAFDTGVHF
jgi:pilus assembly protein CpaF